MVVHEKRTGQKYTKSPIERMMGMREQVANRRISVLAVLPGQPPRPDKLIGQLGIDEYIVCGNMDELIEAASSLRGGRVVASALEIQQADGNMPLKIHKGRQIRAMDLVQEIDPSARLGRVDVVSGLGTSAFAILSNAPRDPLIKEILSEGADPSAMMIARPYEGGLWPAAVPV